MKDLAELIAFIRSKETEFVKFNLVIEVEVDGCIEDTINLDESYSFNDIGLMCEDQQGMYEE